MTWKKQYQAFESELYEFVTSLSAAGHALHYGWMSVTLDRFDRVKIDTILLPLRKCNSLISSFNHNKIIEL